MDKPTVVSCDGRLSLRKRRNSLQSTEVCSRQRAALDYGSLRSGKTFKSVSSMSEPGSINNEQSGGSHLWRSCHWMIVIACGLLIFLVSVIIAGCTLERDTTISINDQNP